MAIGPTPPDALALIRTFLSEEEESAWIGFLQTHATLVRELDAVLARAHGVSLKAFETLVEIAHAPDEGIAIAELADRTLLSPSRMSRLVMELEALELVARHSNPDDRRSTMATITDLGRARLQETAPTYLDAVRTGFLDRLSKTQVRQLASIWGQAGRAPAPMP